MIENIRFTSLITKDQSIPPWFTYSFDRHIKSFGDNYYFIYYFKIYEGNLFTTLLREFVWEL